MVRSWIPPKGRAIASTMDQDKSAIVAVCGRGMKSRDAGVSRPPTNSGTERALQTFLPVSRIS
jgi:hypothetical protein